MPPRDPALLTEAARFYAGQLRRHTEGQKYLASRGVGRVAAARLGLGYSPGNGLRQALESTGFTGKRIQDSGLFMERGTERFAGMVVVPDACGGPVRWLKGRAIRQDVTPRFQALPGPKPVLGLGRLDSAPPLGGRRGGGLRLACRLRSGVFPPAPPWAPRALNASPTPSGAARASSSRSTTTTRAGRRRSGFLPC